LGEYTDKDMVKSLARAIELLTEENKELRQEIKDLRTAPAMWFNSDVLADWQAKTKRDIFFPEEDEMIQIFRDYVNKGREDE